MRLKNLCVMFGVLVFVLLTPFAAMAGWQIETVDSEGDVGKNNSIAIDSSGNVHISYDDSTNGNLNLMYATNASGSWVVTTVDRRIDTWAISRDISIAVDSSDKVHISYLYGLSYDDDNDLKYATNASGSWVTETVDNGVEGWSTSIAVDSSDKVHISYHDESTRNLKYATNASGSWVTETVVDSSYNLGAYSSIAVDSSDKVHISYRCPYYPPYVSDDEYTYLKYATNASGSWVTETAGYKYIYVDYFTSIAVDSSDKVHISYTRTDWEYFSTSTSYLEYATNASGSWVTETVDNSGNVSRSTSVAIDSSDNVHISYYDYTNNDLKYATNASGSWITETMDSRGENTSIALDSLDNVHISYYDSTNGDLKYATNAVPDITVSPESYDFGSIHKWKSSPPTTFTISNTGTADLVIGGVYLTGPNPYQFSIQNDNCSDQTIAPSGSCIIEAIFNPTKTGTFNALIGIDSNDPDTPALNIELTGTGVMGNMKNEGH